MAWRDQSSTPSATRRSLSRWFRGAVAVRTHPGAPAGDVEEPQRPVGVRGTSREPVRLVRVGLLHVERRREVEISRERAESPGLRVRRRSGAGEVEPPILMPTARPCRGPRRRTGSAKPDPSLTSTHQVDLQRCRSRWGCPVGCLEVAHIDALHVHAALPQAELFADNRLDVNASGPGRRDSRS